jgi:C-terminal processing protease CtpA/Prc
MTRFGITLISAALFSLVAGLSAVAQTNSTAPTFQEVYDLIRQHATGLSDAELNRAAVQGLIAALAPKVSLVTNDTSSTSGGSQPVTEAKVYDGDIAYLRIARVERGLASVVSGDYQQLNSTNKIDGVVLDLRYTGGSDYESAASTSDLFVNKKQPLLNWNGGVLSSHEKTNGITVPVAVLVNHDTAGASEALAAMLRETTTGLILGSRTAGAAMVTKDFPLGNGQRLRIASAPIILGDGASLSSEGVKPDIDVNVNPNNERAFYADAFFAVPETNHVNGSSTNLASGTNQSLERVPFNEAELVREHKAGENPDDEDTPKRPPELKVPVVSDPALARALDLLKGLAVVRQNHP